MLQLLEDEQLQRQRLPHCEAITLVLNASYLSLPKESANANGNSWRCLNSETSILGKASQTEEKSSSTRNQREQKHPVGYTYAYVCSTTCKLQVPMAVVKKEKHEQYMFLSALCCLYLSWIAKTRCACPYTMHSMSPGSPRVPAKSSPLDVN